ncbi:MAG: gliding motility-associated C-terminal domain-containing protein [Bacteroidota bacterium]
MRHYLIPSLFAICFLQASGLLAQAPPNDECVDATNLDPLLTGLDWCSDPDAFDNIQATTSLTDYPACLTDEADIRDVWFSFTAQTTDLSITVSGSVPPVPLGTMQTPQFVIYEGSCTNLTAVACQSPSIGDNFSSGIYNNFTVGETYYININARIGRQGTFQICLNQFNAVPEPSGDCATGVVLCDKSSFSVPFLSGNGLIQDPLGDVLCMIEQCGGVGTFGEANAAWYKWTCEDPGSLTFTIDPLSGNAREDLDFLLYELPNGIDDCSDKINLRCMLSGETQGNTLQQNLPCLGETGLSEFDNDDREECGCQAGNNNFVQSIEMEAGRSYALLIMNFSASGDGFSISFGGTGTFEGPSANFVTDAGTACIGEVVNFFDNSGSLDPIVNWDWNFGPNASPSTASGAGPHPVSFDRPGIVNVLLEIETDRGCLVTTIQSNLEIQCCDDHFDIDAQVSSLDCPNDETGAIDLTASSGFAPLVYEWSTGAMSQDISNLGLGDYTVTVSDEATCITEQTFTIDGPPPFAFDTSIVMPTCDGGMDGALTFTLSGGTPSYEYSFDNGPFSPVNTIGNLPVSTVNVRGRDANGCIIEQDIFVNELVLTLDPNLVMLTEPVCRDDVNGEIVLGVNNGLGPYEYDFGSGFQGNPSLNNIPAGTYNVVVRDANRCLGNFTFDIPNPPLLEATLSVDNISCFGAGDGSIVSTVSGGRPDYQLVWSNNVMGGSINNLGPGDYTLTVIDNNGCLLRTQAEVIEPDEIFGELLAVTDNVCFGESAGTALLEAMGGTAPFTFSSDGINFGDDPLLTGLAAGEYDLIVRDSEGCSDTVSATIDQPVEFIISANEFVTIDLGFDTIVNVQSNYQPVEFIWTPDADVNCLRSNCSRVLVSPPNGLTYLVTGINEAGCEANAQVRVVVIKNRPVYIPNVFSPNGDGRNDGFTVFTGPAAFEIDQLRIFDRWGTLIYESDAPFQPNEPSLGWDGLANGKPVNSGVFVYQVDLRFIDGEIVSYAGDVTVLR